MTKIAKMGAQRPGQKRFIWKFRHVLSRGNDDGHGSQTRTFKKPNHDRKEVYLETGKNLKPCLRTVQNITISSPESLFDAQSRLRGTFQRTGVLSAVPEFWSAEHSCCS